MCLVGKGDKQNMLRILFVVLVGMLFAFLLNASYIIALVGLFCGLYLLLPLNMKVYVLITSVVIPFALPFIDIRLIEVLPPVVFGAVLFDTFKYRRIFLGGLPLVFKLAIAIIITWVLINYVHKPVAGQLLLGASFRGGGIRAYYQIVVGILLFFCIFLYFKNHQLKQDNLFKYFIILAFSAGLLRLLGFYYGFSLPFVSGVFNYAEDISRSYTRIGGLNEMTLLGLASVLALSFKKKLTFWLQAALIFFSFLLIPAGGRTFFFAVAGTFLVYFSILERRWLSNYFTYFAIIIVAVVTMSFTPKFSSQIDRLFRIGGGFAAQDTFRSVTHDYYIKSFLANPLFGKGVGYAPGILVGSSRESDFVYQQLMQGGHGAYLSMLGIWGIGGLIFLISMLGGGIYYSIILMKQNQYCQIGVFCFFYLSVLSLTFISNGNGYSSMEMWLLCGLVAALISKDRENNVSN